MNSPNQYPNKSERGQLTFDYYLQNPKILILILKGNTFSGEGINLTSSLDQYKANAVTESLLQTGGGLSTVLNLNKFIEVS